MSKYLRILGRIYNTPLAISQNKFDIISSNVGIKLLSGESIPSIEPTKHKEPTVTSSVAVVNVFDSLVSKQGLGDSGFTSYEDLRKNIQSKLDNGAKKLVFNIDSPGGEVNGLFALTDYIFSLKGEGVETSAVIDGQGTSAAYAIASATGKIYATETSQVGSIATIMGLVDQTEMDKADGLAYYILRSKSEKALGNPHEKVTSEVLDKYQSMLMKVDSIFNEKVAKYRTNLSVDKIISLKGADFLAEEAKTLGLVDSIVSSIDAVVQQKGSNQSTILTTSKGKTMTLEEALAKNVELSSELAEVKAKAEVIAKAAASEEQTRILGILNAASTLKLSSEIAVKRIKAGTSVEESVSLFEDIAEAVQKTTAIDTDVPISATVNKETVVTEEPDFMSQINAAIDKVDAEAKVEWGVR